MQEFVGDPAVTEPRDCDLARVPTRSRDGWEFGLLVDVTMVPLADLVSPEETVLSNALRRLLEELDDPRGVIAGWSSYQP
jgi:FXSXX-COOH protein